MVGDHLVAVNALPTLSREDFKKAVAAAEDATPNANLYIEVKRSDLEPNPDLFGTYCELHPLSRADVVFQSKHRHIGGWCTSGDAAMDVDVMQCDGCPECLFGKPMAGLTEEQQNEPKVLRWAARPGWLRHRPGRPGVDPPRFFVGERVLYRDGKMAPWQEATVMTRKHSEPCWPEGFWVPYTLRRNEDCKIIYTPLDSEDLVKRIHGPPEAGDGPMPSPKVSPKLGKGMGVVRAGRASDLSLYR